MGNGFGGCVDELNHEYKGIWLLIVACLRIFKGIGFYID